MYFLKIKFYKRIKGFTLVETLFAISIFSIALVGLMSVLGKGISDTNYAKSKIIASYLAQEGVEYVRNMRDTYVLYDTTHSAGWDNFKVALAGCPVGTGCGFKDNLATYDIANLKGSTMFFSCDSGGCILNYDPTDGKYLYNENSPLIGQKSEFSRKIEYEVINDVNNEIRITSTVSWSKAGFPRSVSFSSNLAKWIE